MPADSLFWVGSQIISIHVIHAICFSCEQSVTHHLSVQISDMDHLYKYM